MQTIKADHAAEVEGIQKHFEREYRAEVEDREEAFFRVRITELYDALTAHWDAKEAFLERVLKQKLALFKKTKPHSKHPTGPRVTKFPPEVFGAAAVLEKPVARASPHGLSARGGRADEDQAA